MDYPYKKTNEELIDYWTDNYSTLSKEETRILLDEIFNRPELNFCSSVMPLDMQGIILEHLSKSVTRGIYISPPHGEMLVNGDKSAIIKSRQYPLTYLFNILVSGDKAYGYIRFTNPVTVSKSDIEKYYDTHKVSKSDSDRWWPNKENLLIYGVRDYIPFFQTRIVKSCDGSQVFIDPVEYAETPPDFVIKNMDYDFSVVSDDNRLVYGPVLIPDTVDLQGDIISEEEIIKAAHKFMIKSQTMGVEHMVVNDNIRIVESFVTPVDIEVNGRFFKKGTWLAGSKILDDSTWEAVKQGKLTGYSIEGYGKRIQQGD